MGFVIGCIGVPTLMLALRCAGKGKGLLLCSMRTCPMHACMHGAK